MRTRLPLLLSATALAVALLGSTPAGNAAGDLLQKVPPLAKRATFAKTAGTARNALALGGRKPSAYARLDASGKLPASLGAVGPQGPKGDQGDKGPQGEPGAPGISGYTIVQGPATSLAANGTAIARATCPAGKRAVGGGGHHASSAGFVAALASSAPAANTNGTAWQAAFRNLTATPATVWAYAVCATVAP